MSDIVFGGADQEDYAAAKKRLHLVVNNSWVEVEGGVCWRCHIALPDWEEPDEQVCELCSDVMVYGAQDD